MMQLIGFQYVTTDQWRSCCEYVCSVEKYWENDVAIKEEMERPVITVTSSDEDTNTAWETDNYFDTDPGFGHLGQREQMAMLVLLQMFYTYTSLR